jgi:hypothetical protein
VLRITRKTLVLWLAALAMVGTLAVAPALGKSRAVSFTTKGVQNGLKISGKVISGSFGKGTYTGLVINDGTGSKLTLKVSGGTVSIQTKAKIVGRALTGTWRITSATGKWKGTQASGPLSGDFTTGIVKFKH